MPNDPGRPAIRGFARCPRCQELIDSASETCRFCGVSISAEEMERSAALQQKLVEAKSKANDRSSLTAAIKALVIGVVVFTLWFLARYFRV